jgi:hypothetical protein
MDTDADCCECLEPVLSDPEHFCHECWCCLACCGCDDQPADEPGPQQDSLWEPVTNGDRERG